jgi:hypothetical protein
MDTVDNMVVDKIHEPDETAIGAMEDNPQAEPFGDFDEAAYKKMTPEERDAWLAQQLGEDFDGNLDEIEIATDELDLDGNFIRKTRSEAIDEADQMQEEMAAFVDCFDSPDVGDE